MAFTEGQKCALSAKLAAKHVKTRAQQGQTFRYIEGWHAIAEANRIFGFDGWDRTTLTTECVWSGRHRGDYVCTYTAKVRVQVRAGETDVTREGCGSGEGKGQTPGEAHDAALKAAETDATKRALATFGNPFGLALYDREMRGVRNAGRIAMPDKAGRSPQLALKPGGNAPVRYFDEPAAFAAALRDLLERAASIDSLFDLWEKNVDSVRALERANRGGDDTAQSLVAHFKQCAAALAKPVDEHRGEGADAANGHAPACEAIDKSALAISEPKRLRSKEHLRYVASRPCLLCGREPAQAHHLRFAQPRAMALKPSDAFVVPLCSLHHRALHDSGNEEQWWKTHAIDPLPVAEKLWAERVGNGHSDG